MKAKKKLEIMGSAKNADTGFEDILNLSTGCKFSDCTHTNETDCVVKKAIAEGILSEEKFNHYYQVKYAAAYVSKQRNKTKAMDYMKQRKLFQRSDLK
ncbi:hypothetical protein [Fictibacillus barbaricus]|uniref:Ribosome biogenesis GTPase n=1 Tax=Fictibacillus barbaricus TaxID=182136 RepID=A0ABU1U4H2_9BACL|nr:hypothetical protein [Fictibacillus barbaricus]MDR7074378.1 ribosome biogenesis GTPase [Fictibacillus barbaricus]